MKLTLNQILLGVIALLVLILAVGTAAGLTNRHNQKPEVLIAQGKAVNLAAPVNSDVTAYYQLGTIRIVSNPDSSIKDDTGAPMVVSPWIAYPEGDTVFYEEISRKTGIIKAVFTQFFTGHTQKEILSFGEEKIKNELLSQINELLSLGKISDLYFTDFLFL